MACVNVSIQWYIQPMVMGEATQPRVSDEVWEAIAPEAGSVDERERRALRHAALGLAVLVVLAVLAWWSGVPVPRLTHGDSSGGQSDSGRRTGVYEFDVVNRGLLPVTVTAVDVEVPGVVTTSMRPPSLRVAGGASAPVRLDLQIEDCTAALRGMRARPEVEQPAIRARVSRPWGAAHATVAPGGATAVWDVIRLACGDGAG